MGIPDRLTCLLRKLFSSVQFSRSVMSDSLRPHRPQNARPPCPSPNLSLPRLTSNELVMPSNHLILCHALLLPPSMFPSNRAFSKELSLCIRWPKFWSTGFSISSSNEYSGLVFFRIDCFVLLEIQGAPQSLLQDCSLKASVLQRSQRMSWGK